MKADTLTLVELKKMIESTIEALETEEELEYRYSLKARQLSYQLLYNYCLETGIVIITKELFKEMTEPYRQDW